MEELLNSLFNWRPASDITPKTEEWANFEVENKKLAKKVNVKIQTITPDQYENVIGFMTQWFLQNETSSKAAKILEDEISTAIWQGLWLRTFQQGISVVAMTDEETPQIVGALVICAVSEADQVKEELPGPAIRRHAKLLTAFDEKINKYKIYESEYFMQDWGLCTSPEWENCGIGAKLLSVIPQIGQHYKLPAAIFIFTSKRSQSLGKKAGFQDYAEVNYADVKDEAGECALPTDSETSAILAGLKIY